MKLLVINGPNLNLLGTREPDIYGSRTYAALARTARTAAAEAGVRLKMVQSNHEGKIVDIIQKAAKKYDGIVINPAAYTHTSVALMDAIKAVGIPAVEVHLSNIHSREEFRKTSLIAPACIGQISGFGAFSYILGVRALVDYLNKRNT